MWNQWSAGPPPIPPPSTANPQPPLIGPVQPNSAPPLSEPVSHPSGTPSMQPAGYAAPSGAPSYTPAQYAAMTPEQQYAVQQHWQQWQAYEQQYAQWHAQYGEQYKREMAAIHGAPPPVIPQYNLNSSQAPVGNSYAYPPPALSNPYQAPQAPTHAPPPPPPDDNANSMGIKAPPQIYEQPPPPPPPPQKEEKQEKQNMHSVQFQGVPPVQVGNAPVPPFRQNQDSQWSQPPPPMTSQGNRWGESAPMGGQQDRQQHNPNQGSRWNDSGPEGQQDRQQQNQFNQQFNNNNQRGQQRDERGRESRQNNNRQSNDFRGRARGRGGNNFESNRQQNFDDTEGRNNRQQQPWQRSESPGQRNNRGNFNNRFENYDNYNKNMGQGSSGWNNNNQGNSFSSDNQRQQQNLLNQNNTNSVGNSQNNAKTNSGSVDEKAFDEQFRLWEEQFENWKKENANHPDRTMYMQYEREFEKTRVRLLERREQMRRRKMMELQQSGQQQPNQAQVPQLQSESLHQDSEQQKPDSEVLGSREGDDASETKQDEASDMEQSENEDSGLVTSIKQIEPTSESEVVEPLKKKETADANVFKNKEITELFKTGGGIPGLDLVGSKEDEKIAIASEVEPVSEVIDLDNDGPSRPAKIAATSTSIASLLPSTMQQPSLKPLLPDLGTRQQSSFTSSQPQKRKIPSLFDIVVEKPLLSPDLECRNKSPAKVTSPTASRSSKADIGPAVLDSPSRSISKDRDVLASPGQRPSSQLSSMSQRQQIMENNPEGSNDEYVHQPFSNQQLQLPPNLPPQAADLAKALQDPNVMQLLTVALAQAQQTGGMNSGGNSQQNQLIQQLQQLQPLLHMQLQQLSNNQRWNNSELQRPQLWENQNTNVKTNPNSNQSRNSWGGNPFNRSNDQLPLNRGPGSGNDSDGNNDMQQRNPHNPFRRSAGGERGSGSDDNSIGRNFEGSSGNNPFNNNGQGLFGGPSNVQQQRGGNFGGGGRFDNNRPHSNFGNSLGFRNNPNNFGDRGGDNNDYYRPAQVFDYQNRSRADAIVPPAKVVDYGHRPSAVLPTNSFNRDNSEFVPVKTIDYGHASNSAQNDNQFQQKKSNFMNQTSRWSQVKQTNQEQAQSRGQAQLHGVTLSLGQNFNESSLDMSQNKSGSLLAKEQNMQNQKQNPNEVTKQIKKASVDKNKDVDKLAQNEDFNELGDENTPSYPFNKWVLQNPESRQRPGPPTKRGKRNQSRFEIQQKSPPQYTNSECDEIEENFEEISDTEDINEIVDVPQASTHLKAKSQPLFPSVSDTIANASVVFPSMENNNTIPIDEILFKPGRLTRPKNIVIIIRGPPGSGKSHVAKLIKDKEVEMGGPTPRLLSIDDYFMIENDYEEKCPKTGRKIPKKEILYEYEKEMEDTYMQYLIKSFKKTVTDHLFDFIIVDCCNQSLRTFNEFYNAARDGNFSPFIIDMMCDVDICLNQNIHNRNEDDIKNIIKNYQECPGHYIKLDVSNLLENVVEMEDVSDLEDNFAADSEVIDLDEDDEVNENNGGGFLKSKWDTDPTTENLARLDGTSKPISKRGTATLEEYLQIDGWEPPSSSTNGKKSVRWADIEEKRAQDKMRAIGFVVGQTDWNRMMDPTSGSGALTKTKYIERLNKRR